ncbi:MAG TPA: Hsp20/alpha crystallin family protein [bacterium]|jgi:HSP20 family protein
MIKSEDPSSDGIQFAGKRSTHSQYHFFQFYSSQHAVLTAGTGWFPPVDLYETPTEFVLEVNLAGIAPEQVRLSFEGSLLHITGQRDELGEPGVRCYHIMEIERGAFARTLELPSAVDGTTARAVFHDGLLLVHVQKKEGGQIHGCFSADSMEGLE